MTVHVACEGELAMPLYPAAVKFLPAPLAVSIRIGYTSLAILILLTLQAFAETVEQVQLREALKLGNQGKFGQEAQLLDSLVHSDPAALDDINRGKAWNTLGTLHMLLGDNERSRQCYENAIRLLRKLPAASSAYASALANLSSLEMSLHQFEDAEVSLCKAQEIEGKAGDHVGLQEIALYRANIEITRNNTRAAQSFVADAFREAGQVKDLSVRDQATMYSVTGALAAKVKDFKAAAEDYQQSINFWTQACGAKCYYVGVESAFQADVYRELGDYRRAEDAITEALALTEESLGRNAPLYAAMEIIHAHVLRAMGSKAEAEAQEADAKQRLDTMRHRQCNGCSISAMGYR
jgi:tetratricopeptide (TPR) repeat protein